MEAIWVTFIIFVAIIILSIIYWCKNKFYKDRSETTIDISPQRSGFQALPTSMPLPPSEYRENNFQSIPYPPITSQYSPEPPAFADHVQVARLGFGEHFPSAPSCNAVPHTSTSRHISRTRSYSAEDLPPSYAEVVEQQPQATGNHQRKYISEASVYENL